MENRNETVYATELDGMQFVTKERWQAMVTNKAGFLAGNAGGWDSMCSGLAGSWARSREAGVDPFKREISACLGEEELATVLANNEILISITQSLFQAFRTPEESSGYSLYLFDKDGVLLLFNGTAGNPERIRIGKVFNEQTVGTCSHVLSMRYRCPVQIIGPEQYSCYYQNMIGSAAPIMDAKGRVLATLVLNQRLSTNPVIDKNLQDLCAHTFGLIITMAAAIKGQMDLRQSYDTLAATLDCIDEGIVHVDLTGLILQANSEARRMLDSVPALDGRKIKEFLEPESTLMQLIARGGKASVEETLCLGAGEQPYVINIQPVRDRHTDRLNGAILRFNHIHKINDIVNSRSGAMASYSFADIVGESRPMKRAIELGEKFAGLQETILLLGDSGTGKEMFAQAIHNRSCPGGPFIAVNCAALPRELIESELFGYEGGSFTGANRSGRPGKIELAHGGTLFLDEIGDMPLEIQSVLLRVIEDKQVMRIGGRHYKKVDFKIIAATNKDFQSVMRAGLFREDLYFRLSVLTIKLPSLQEREGDAELLSRYFIEKYCRKTGRHLPEISSAVCEKIRGYSWPGNVRQLENTMIYAINLSRDNIITPDCLPDSMGNGSSELNKIIAAERAQAAFSMEEWEKTGIQIALMRAENNVPQAAELLKLSKSTLYRKIKEYEIKV